MRTVKRNLSGITREEASDWRRRNLTKGQQAMAMAMIYPNPERGRGKKDEARKGAVTAHFQYRRVQEARTVLHHSEALAHAVIGGTVSLSAWGAGRGRFCAAPCRTCGRLSAATDAVARWFRRAEVVSKSNDQSGRTCLVAISACAYVPTKSGI